MVAPCCRQRARVELGRPAPLAPVLAHGVMYQRLAEWVTDALRALMLEQAGYRTKMIEFVDPEHTVQNIMIAGIRTGQPFNWDAPEALKSFWKFGLLSAIEVAHVASACVKKCDRKSLVRSRLISIERNKEACNPLTSKGSTGYARRF